MNQIDFLCVDADLDGGDASESEWRTALSALEWIYCAYSKLFQKPNLIHLNVGRASSASSVWQNSFCGAIEKFLPDVFSNSIPRRLAPAAECHCFLLMIPSLSCTVCIKMRIPFLRLLLMLRRLQFQIGNLILGAL